MENFKLKGFHKAGVKNESFPLFKEIVKFVLESRPMLDRVNTTIDRNLKSVPGAQSHLSDISSENENAANKILDIVESINLKIEKISSEFEYFEKKQNYLKRSVSIIEELKKENCLSEKAQHKLSELEAVIRDCNSEKMQKVRSDLNSLADDTTSIILNMQFQDITSQKLAVVNHILFNLHSRLKRILIMFEDDETAPESSIHKKDTGVARFNRDVAFDSRIAEAEIDSKKKNDLDVLMKKFGSTGGKQKISGDFKIEKDVFEVTGKRHDILLTQDEIDELFEE